MMNSHRAVAAPQNILVVRNDKLGDFMLAWPSFARLKQAFPEARILALVPNYTAPMAELCPWIDEVILDPGKDAALKQQLQLIKRLRRIDIDLMVTLFSTTRVGVIGWLSAIPTRWAPATKLAQLFYNRRLKQRRSRSEKPEFAYNLDLAEAAIQEYAEARVANPQAAQQGPYLALDDTTVRTLDQQFRQTLGIDKDKRLVFIHAGSGGSANNLSLDQYAELAKGLATPELCFVLTAGPGELDATQQLENQLRNAEVDCRLFHSQAGLADFAKHLALADLFIAGSTGTLHIAGALDRPTVGFYPNRRSSTPLRWQTLNSAGRYLAFTPPSEVEKDMSRVDLKQAIGEIKGFLARL